MKREFEFYSNFKDFVFKMQNLCYWTKERK